MHVLARGDLLQRLRLASGLVLFTFAATHFLNHALGLVSLDAMQEMQAWRKVVTRSWIGLGRPARRVPHPHRAGALQDLAAADLEAAVLGGGADRHRPFHPALSHHPRRLQPRRGDPRRHRRHLRLRARQHLAGPRLGALGAAAGRVGARLHRHALLAEPGVLVSAACGRCCSRLPWRCRSARSRASRWRGGRWRPRSRRRAPGRSCRRPRARPMRRPPRA